MKRRIFSVFFALVLVLSFSLVTAVPVAAQTTYGVVPYTLSTGTNAAAWSTVQKATGSSSVLLNYVSGDSSYVEFTPATGITVNDLSSITDGWSWWYYASAAYGPLLELRFSAPGSGHVDITVDTAEVSPAITTGTTEEVTNASTCIYYGNDDTNQTSFSNVTGSVTLAGVLASINAQQALLDHTETADAWELTRVRAEIGWSAPARTCYIDDIEIAGVTYYGSIQDAIDVSSDGDTITVAAGTYVEEITVDEDLTITCTATTTITGDVHFASEPITMTDATLDTGYEWYVDSNAAKIQEVIDAASASDTINVLAGTYSENVEVTKSVTLEGAGSSLVTVISTHAVAAFTVTANNVEISGFTMTGTGIDPEVNLPLAGVYLDSVDGCNISDNVMVGESHGVYLDVGSDGNTITGNNASDNNQGFTVEPYGTTGVSADNIFTDNIANSNWKYGFFVEDGEGNTFTGNTANLNTRNGFKFVDGEDNTLNYNNIVGNTLEGVKQCGANLPAVDLDAQYNYWGDPSGPTVTTNARGAGDTVTVTIVDYEPWLHTTKVTVFPSGVRYYAYNWCDLTKGWNIWSTPIAPDTQADTWGEYKLLGVNLDLASGSSAYYFDASAPGWDLVTDSYVLRPCDAIYIKVASNQEAPILFSPSYSAPTKTLYAGWNLVSASYIDDMDSPTIATGLAAEDVLASVYNVPGTNNLGYSMVVSPATGQAGWSGVRGPDINTTVGSEMLPCEGYWVFMTNAGVLAGTVFTPVSPLLP